MTTDMVDGLLVRVQDDTADMRRRLGGVEGAMGTCVSEVGALREAFEAFRAETVEHFERLEMTMAEPFTLVVDRQQKVYGPLRAS